MKITNQRIPMVLPEVQAVCPSAFTTTVAPHLSQNYTHIPTSQVVADMIELGWTPEFNLENGILETANWYRNWYKEEKGIYT